jgi:hypothetical protein
LRLDHIKHSLVVVLTSETMNNSSPATDEPARLPKDATIVQAMLQEMGISNYEPKLIPMVLDFMHRSLRNRCRSLCDD